jgi:hypothetical protein
METLISRSYRCPNGDVARDAPFACWEALEALSGLRPQGWDVEGEFVTFELGLDAELLGESVADDWGILTAELDAVCARWGLTALATERDDCRVRRELRVAARNR